VRRETIIGRILVPALALLLLCGIVAAEVPEFLSLTDNAANDFTIRRANTRDARVLVDASKHLRVSDLEFGAPALELCFSRLSQSVTVAAVSAKLYILHSDLRT
jgi:hypothetical protein